MGFLFFFVFGGFGGFEGFQKWLFSPGFSFGLFFPQGFLLSKEEKGASLGFSLGSFLRCFGVFLLCKLVFGILFAFWAGVLRSTHINYLKTKKNVV